MTDRELYERRGFDARRSREFKSAAEAFEACVLSRDRNNIDAQAAFARGWRAANEATDERRVELNAHILALTGELMRANETIKVLREALLWKYMSV